MNFKPGREFLVYLRLSRLTSLMTCMINYIPITQVFMYQNKYILAHIYSNLYHSEGTDLELNIYLSTLSSSWHGAKLIRVTTSQFRPAVIYSEVTRILIRLPHLFLGGFWLLRAVVPSGKGIHSSCSKGIIPPILQLCIGRFSRRTLRHDALFIAVSEGSSKFCRNWVSNQSAKFLPLIGSW
jgi:hypothetical protein